MNKARSKKGDKKGRKKASQSLRIISTACRKGRTPALFTFFMLLEFSCVRAASHAIVLPSAVLWHMCVTISPLNSCLIIPNLREYSNKAFNAFFHMILRRRDSCSAALSAMFRKATDSSAHLIGEEVRDFQNKSMVLPISSSFNRNTCLGSWPVATLGSREDKERTVREEGRSHFCSATVCQFVWNAHRGDYNRVNFATQ